MNTYDSIKYTLRHWLSYQKVALKCGIWKPRFLLHDIDKLFLYLFFTKEETHKIHQNHSSHHVRNDKVIDPLAAVIDWECARFTKPDKPLNARQTWEKYYPKCKDVEPFIKMVEIIHDESYLSNEHIRLRDWLKSWHLLGKNKNK